MDKELVFINYINDHYQELYNRFQAFCNDKNYQFDEDIFQDTVLKCYNLIKRKGLEDISDKGIENYFFMSFKQNLQREKQYARNQKRDGNVVDLSGVYERYTNTLLTEREKLQADLYKDFATLYLLSKAEEHFDYEHFYLFRLKTFDKNMTYQKLQEKTGLKGVRQKVVDVKNWLKQNVKQSDVRSEFEAIYGDFL
jgi:hypothetical protein